MIARRALIPLKLALAIVVLAMVILAVTLVFDRHADVYPDTAESSMTYICEQCGHVFSLTAKQAVEARKAGKTYQPDDAKYLAILLPCPACGKVAARPAYRCPKCGKLFLPNRDDTLPPCPACGWTERRR